MGHALYEQIRGKLGQQLLESPGRESPQEGGSFPAIRCHHHHQPIRSHYHGHIGQSEASVTVTFSLWMLTCVPRSRKASEVSAGPVWETDLKSFTDDNPNFTL